MEQDFNEKHWSNPCPKYDCRKAACKCGLEYVNIPTSLGDDSADSNVAPRNGAYCNALVIYEANNHVYIYSKEGVPTLIDVDASDISTLEQEVIKAQKDVHELREDIDRFAYFFDTVADMKASNQLQSGDYAKTLGYYGKGDGGGACYKISNVQPSNYYETLSGMLYAELVPQESTILTKQFGILGDGLTDETSRLQSFFDYGTSNYVINSNDILVDGNISLGSNSNIVFNEGCKITRKTNSLSTYFMFLVDNKHDINIVNAHLVGDRETHTGSSGEWGHGINIVCSSNIKIDNALIEQTWGDGIYIGLYSPSGNYNSVNNVTVTNSHINRCSRNGISICSGSNISVTNCLVEHTDRTWPKSGIDVELEGPEGSTPSLYNVSIDNVRTLNNYKGIQVYDGIDYVASGIIINNHYSRLEVESFVISAFDNNDSTMVYKNGYIELCSGYPIQVSKLNNNLIVIKDIICDSSSRISDTPGDFYGIINLFNNNTEEDGGGIVFDNIQAIENHKGNNYKMYKTVLCRNNTTTGRIANVTLKNTRKTDTAGRVDLVYLFGNNYDYATISMVNCEDEFISNYYQVDLTRGCPMTKITRTLLAAMSTTAVSPTLLNGDYEIFVGNCSSYGNTITFDNSYSVWRGSDNSSDYRVFTTNKSGAYLHFKKLNDNIYILDNIGYNASQA